MDHAQTLKDLIADELSLAKPSFRLVDQYVSALREVVQTKARNREGGPSLDDDDDERQTDNDESGFVFNGATATYAVPSSRARKTRHGSENDEMLAAMGDIASRSGPDPLSAILANLPAVESLWPEDGRQGLRDKLRALVSSRLGVVKAAMPDFQLSGTAPAPAGN